MKTDNNAFEVAKQAEHELIQKFKLTHVKHGHYDTCYERTKCLCLRNGTSGVVILTGPTGSGKTHLARNLYHDLRQSYQGLSPADVTNLHDTLIPVAGLRAVPPRATAFDWEDFYIRLLEQLRDILVERKLLVPSQMSLFGEMPMPVAADSIKVRVLRRSVEKALRHRKTRVLIIDEAHHILMCRDPEMQKFAFEQLKSLTDETGIVLVLVGTYDLLDIRDHSGQLMRRSEIVHLQRYDYNDSTHLTAFKDVFAKLRKAMTIPLHSEKSEEGLLLDLCYRKSVGCVGILFDLLLEAQRRALESSLGAVAMKLIEQSAKSNTAMITILEEAKGGEVRLTDVEDEELRTMMLDGPGSIRTDTKIEKGKSRSSRQLSRRPGIRNPGRDMVGGI